MTNIPKAGKKMSVQAQLRTAVRFASNLLALCDNFGLCYHPLKVAVLFHQFLQGIKPAIKCLYLHCMKTQFNVRRLYGFPIPTAPGASFSLDIRHSLN